MCNRLYRICTAMNESVAGGRIRSDCHTALNSKETRRKLFRYFHALPVPHARRATIL